jgi:hypothetical protein
MSGFAVQKPSFDIDETNHFQEQMDNFRKRREEILNRIINQRPEEDDEITLIASETTIFHDEIKLEKCKDFFIFSLARLRQMGFVKEITEITLFFAMLIGLLKIASKGIDVSTDIFNLIVGILPFIKNNAMFITFITSGIVTLFSFFGYSVVDLKQKLYDLFRGDRTEVNENEIKESIKKILNNNILFIMTENVDISKMLIKYQAYIITCLEYLQSIGCPNFDFKTIFIDFITNSKYVLQDVLQDVCTNIIETGKNMIENNANYLAAFDDNDSVVSDYKSIRPESSGSSTGSTGSTGSESSESSQETIANVVNTLLELKETELTEKTLNENLITLNDSFIISSSKDDNSTISTRKSQESQKLSLSQSSHDNNDDDDAYDRQERERDRKSKLVSSIIMPGGSKRKSKTSKKTSKQTKRTKKTSKRAKKSTKKSKKH